MEKLLVYLPQGRTSTRAHKAKMGLVFDVLVVLALVGIARGTVFKVIGAEDATVSIDLVRPGLRYSFQSSAESDIQLRRNDEECVFAHRLRDGQPVFESEFDLVLRGEAAVDALYYGDVRQWQLAFFEDFQGPRREWSQYLVSTCQNNENVFLGGHCNFAGDETHLAIALPEHSEILIKFSLHFIDDWQGETFVARLDSQVFAAITHNWCEKLIPWFCKKYNINVCGKDDIPDTIGRVVEHAQLHSGETITLSFTSNLQKRPCEASWGIDDLQIFVR